MSACASACIPSKATANFSNSTRDADPNSLQGARCSANSITPFSSFHDKALPPRPLISVVFSCTLTSFMLPSHATALHRLLHPVHSLDLILHSRRDHIPLQLSIHRQHPALNRERFPTHVKRPHLLVMRQLRIHHIQRGLHPLSRHAPGHNRRQISPPVSHHHHLLRFR